MAHNLKFLSLVITIIVCSFSLSFALHAADLSKDFDQYVQKTMNTWNVPGVSIAVVKDDKIVYIKGFGVKEQGKPYPIDSNTDFAIASGTKSFTATALAMLVEEGKIKWDDPIVKYMPDIRFYDDKITRTLTFRDLLSHHTPLIRDDRMWHETNFTREDLINRIGLLKPMMNPKSSWNYNNMMYLVAGEVIPAVTGESWDQFVKERIFQPLGMNKTNTSVNTFKQYDDIATPHKIRNGRPFPIAWKNVDNIGPAIAINSNAKDMAQWIRFQLSKGRVGNKQLLSTGTIDEMQNVQTLIPDSPWDRVSYPNAQISYYGLGWRMHNYHGNRVVEHEGMVDGMTSLVAMLPEKHIGIVILTNQDINLLPTAVMYRAFDTMLDIPTQDWGTTLYEQFALVN